MIRLDKLLSSSGLGSRSEVRALIRAGRVNVDGKPCLDPGFSIDEHGAQITFDGAPLVIQMQAHLMMNKPAGLLTAARDRRQPTVMDLLPEQYARMGCMPIGRLDKDTEGLLLFTTDGQLAHRLLSPRRHVEKVYLAAVDGQLDASDVTAFADGLALSDFRAMPAALTILPDACSAHVTVCEGKFHQVKRMFAARGRRVIQLRRLSFAEIALDASLEPGGWRALTADEYAQLCRAAEGVR